VSNNSREVRLWGWTFPIYFLFLFFNFKVLAAGLLDYLTVMVFLTSYKVKP